MTNRTEWVTNADVEMKVLDFGDVGKNLTDGMTQDIEMFCYSTQIPAVLLGMANVAEGLGKEQGEGLDRTIASIQEIIETEIESKIYKPYLRLNGIDAEVEFIWNLPGEEEITLRLTQLNTMLSNPFLSDGMRRQIQVEIGRLLHFEDAENLVDTPNTQGQTADKNPVFTPDGKQFTPGENKTQDKKNENERKKEEAEPQPIIPGQSLDLSAPEKIVCSAPECGCKEVTPHLITESEMGTMSIKEFVNLVEMPGFNYSDYMLNILKRVKTDKFEQLSAITEADLEKGLLTSDQVDKLRIILKDAFRKNKSIQDIEVEIRDNLQLKDRIKEDGSILPASNRPILISRTETIRLANLGLLDTYKANDVNKVRWLSAYSDRTCEDCESLNGQVFNLEESYGMIPRHMNCRCSWLSIQE
jgi:SPP1 gp7 family putative phage head morphogenesis protein